jgi:hypothetical protein
VHRHRPLPAPPADRVRAKGDPEHADRGGFLSIMVTIQTPTGKARITAASGVCPKSPWLTAQITVSRTMATTRQRTTKALPTDVAPGGDESADRARAPCRQYRRRATRSGTACAVPQRSFRSPRFGPGVPDLPLTALNPDSGRPQQAAFGPRCCPGRGSSHPGHGLGGWSPRRPR